MNMALPVLCGGFIMSRCRLLRTQCYKTSTILLVTTYLSGRRYEGLVQVTRRLKLRILLRVRNRHSFRCTRLRPSVCKVGGHGLKAFIASIRGDFQLSRVLPGSMYQIDRDKVSLPRAILELERRNKFEKFLVNRRFVGRTRPKRTLTRFVGRLGS